MFSAATHHALTGQLLTRPRPSGATIDTLPGLWDSLGEMDTLGLTR